MLVVSFFLIIKKIATITMLYVREPRHLQDDYSIFGPGDFIKQFGPLI